MTDHAFIALITSNAIERHLTMLAVSGIYPRMGANIDPRVADALEALLVELTSLQGHMSLHQLVTIITIYLSPGMSVNELAEKTAVPQQTASRTIAMLMGRYQTEDDQPGAVTFVEQRVSVTDPRSRAVFLTDDGRSLVERMARLLRRRSGSSVVEGGL